MKSYSKKDWDKTAIVRLFLDVSEKRIASVGRKWVTLESGYRYLVETGIGESGGNAWPSEAHRADDAHHGRLVDLVIRHLRMSYVSTETLERVVTEMGLQLPSKGEK